MVVVIAVCWIFGHFKHSYTFSMEIAIDVRNDSIDKNKEEIKNFVKSHTISSPIVEINSNEVVIYPDNPEISDDIKYLLEINGFPYCDQ